MKSWLSISAFCFFLSAFLPLPAQTPTFDQQRAASSALVAQRYPAALDPQSHLSKCAEKLHFQWQHQQDWRLAHANFPLFLWEAADVQRQHEERLAARLAQIRAGYVTPAPAPVSTSPSLPVSKSGAATVIHSAGQGVYTTHGGAAGGATIIQTVPGVWEVRSKDGTMQRVLKP